MKKILLLAFLSIFCMAMPLYGQTSKTPPKTETQTQRKPSPYVFKTDYEAKIKEVDAKANTAANTAIGLKRELSGKLDKVEELDSKMQQVEEILNSANFKISTTSDSLSKTKFSVKEFKEETAKELVQLRANAEKQRQLIWVALGVVFLLIVITFLLLNNMLRNMRKGVEQQGELLNTKIEDAIKHQNKVMADEIGDIKMRMVNETNRLRKEMTNYNESTAQQLQTIIDRLNPPEDIKE